MIRSWDSGIKIYKPWSQVRRNCPRASQEAAESVAKVAAEAMEEDIVEAEEGTIINLDDFEDL